MAAYFHVMNTLAQTQDYNMLMMLPWTGLQPVDIQLRSLLTAYLESMHATV